MRKIAVLGFGKIGRAILKGIREHQLGEILFVQDPNPNNFEDFDVEIVKEPSESLYREVELIVECATPSALDDNLEMILTHADLLPFSLTAFSDINFEENVLALARKYRRHIFIPHGAILGLDGIIDGRDGWRSVQIETVKHPASLGRKDSEKTVLYEGNARSACQMFPRNMNVHAAVALAGIGFDKTRSKIISDPGVNTNSHRIEVCGEGINIKMDISSFSEGGVSGAYTPLSAFGSVRRILERDSVIRII